MSQTDVLELVGRTIAHKYLVERVVGSGGFAIVYRATHLVWKHPVALKVFRTLAEVPDADRQRLFDAFVREGALLAELSTRTAAIVQARDAGVVDTPHAAGLPYIVLEWLEGATLEQVLDAERRSGVPPRPMPAAVRLLDPAAIALALAHRAGIAHRDVKTGNVFVIGDPRGEPVIKLVDFGIAKVMSDANRIAAASRETGNAIVSFTPAYGAPEQFSRSLGSTGPWTDVFALALILGEVTSGRDALQGEDLVQLAAASTDREHRPTPRSLGVEVDDAVEAVFAKALAVAPEDRWQSAGDFWDALRQALRLSTRPAATAVARSSWTRRAAGAASLVTVAAAALGLTHLVNPSRSGSVLASGASSRGASGSPARSAAIAHAQCPAGMIHVPGGSFFMGSDDGPPMERPAHPVTIAPFCIDEFEVTVQEYVRCSDVGRCKRAGTTNEWPGITGEERAAFDPLCNVRDPAGHARHPVNCIDWSMAERYCREQGARLPTEAEWEFAARGPDGRKYPWGDDAPTGTFLNACGTECAAWGRAHGIGEKPMYPDDDGFANTAPVGSFPRGASRYGVQDVVGNVWEWVADWYGPYPAASSSDERDPHGPGSGSERVIPGGAWNGSYATWVRPTFRYKADPEQRSYGIGVRCAK